jgi:hypothetical protein
MTIELPAVLDATLRAEARREGLEPEAPVLRVLRERYARNATLPEPRDEWERRLLAMGRHAGVSLSNEALSREEMYD